MRRLPPRASLPSPRGNNRVTSSAHTGRNSDLFPTVYVFINIFHTIDPRSIRIEWKRWLRFTMDFEQVAEFSRILVERVTRVQCWLKRGWQPFGEGTTTFCTSARTKWKVIRREKDWCDCCVGNPKQGENKGRMKGRRRRAQTCFRFLRGTMHLYRWRGGEYREGPIWMLPRLRPTRLYFVPSISPLSLTGVKPDNVTSHWSRFGARNSRFKFTLSYDNLHLSIGQHVLLTSAS